MLYTKPNYKVWQKMVRYRERKIGSAGKSKQISSSSQQQVNASTGAANHLQSLFPGLWNDNDNPCRVCVHARVCVNTVSTQQCPVFYPCCLGHGGRARMPSEAELQTRQEISNPFISFPGVAQ